MKQFTPVEEPMCNTIGNIYYVEKKKKKKEFQFSWFLPALSIVHLSHSGEGEVVS